MKQAMCRESYWKSSDRKPLPLDYSKIEWQSSEPVYKKSKQYETHDIGDIIVIDGNRIEGKYIGFWEISSDRIPRHICCYYVELEIISKTINKKKRETYTAKILWLQLQKDKRYFNDESIKFMENYLGRLVKFKASS